MHAIIINLKTVSVLSRSSERGGDRGKMSELQYSLKERKKHELV